MMGAEYTHLFGEMDLYLDKSPKQIAKHAVSIAEQCGYFVMWDGDILKVGNLDGYEKAYIYFEKNKVVKVERSIDGGKNWEQLDFKEKVFGVSDKTLKKYLKDIKWFDVEPAPSLPMSYGLLLQELIKVYQIRPVKVGYSHNGHVAIETKKQIIAWRDTGVGAELLGLINKEEEVIA